MPVVAAAAYLALLVLAFGLRSWIHYRRTGSTGFVGISGAAGSMEWCGGVLFTVALVAGGLASALALTGTLEPWQVFDGPRWRAAGLVLWAAGTAGTLWAQLAMGDSWRIGVDESERTALVTGGPFRWVRNPIFTAMAVATAGIALLVPNAAAAVALGTLLLALQIQVRLVEEPYLLRVHGEPYARWCASAGRFLPGIGRRKLTAGRTHGINPRTWPPVCP